MPTNKKTRPPIADQPTSSTDRYDALTQALEDADALTEHLADRLEELSSGDPRELYALGLIAEIIRVRHARILEQARVLFAAAGGGR